MPGREKARWRWCFEGGKRDSALFAASSIESSSMRMSVYEGEIICMTVM
jgi:hypothetical protein